MLQVVASNVEAIGFQRLKKAWQQASQKENDQFQEWMANAREAVTA